jgi:hypothetical protein
MDLLSKEAVAGSIARRGRERFSPASISLDVEVYNAMIDAYSRDRSTIDRDPYLLCETLVEDGYLLLEPPVDVVIGAQDLIRAVER